MNNIDHLYFIILSIVMSIFIMYYTYFIKNIKDLQELQNKEIDKLKSYNNTNNNTDNTDNNINNINNNLDFIWSLPVTKYIENRDRDIIYDPLVEPKRRYTQINYENLINYKNAINIPTRGYPDEYQLIGLLSRINDEKLIQLFGRQKYRGADTWEYYVLSNEFGANIKIPISSRGNRELENGQKIHLKEFNGDFEVRLYNYNEPRYIPIV
jgi:hypothetical protein